MLDDNNKSLIGSLRVGDEIMATGRFQVHDIAAEHGYSKRILAKGVYSDRSTSNTAIRLDNNWITSVAKRYFKVEDKVILLNSKEEGPFIVLGMFDNELWVKPAYGDKPSFSTKIDNAIYLGAR
jgi:hypothetical protein